MEAGVTVAECKTECERLMNDILPLAIEMLEGYGEFYPYGGYVTTTGETVHVGVQNEETDHSQSQPLIDTMVEEFKTYARAGKCRATAIVIDVKVKEPEEAEKKDAIQVRLDHRDGYSVSVFFRYQLSRSRKLELEPPYATKGDSLIFGAVN